MQIFVKPLQIIYQLILNYQELKYLGWSNQGDFFGGFLGPLLKTGLPLIKNVIKPLAKSVLIPLGLTAAAFARDAGIHKKILRSEHNHPLSTTLIISNNEMEDIIKIVKSFEDSRLLLKGVNVTFQNEVKEQKVGILSILLATLGGSLLGNILAGKGINRTGKGWGINRAGEGWGIVRAGYRNKKSKKTTKWIFNTASPIDKFWITKILSK